MRTTVVVVIALVLGVLFIVQKRHEQSAATAAAARASTAAAAQKPATPRPVSEHNWAKHSLDTTRKVTDQLAAQRKADGIRK
jgi:hypothetical protein